MNARIWIGVLVVAVLIICGVTLFSASEPAPTETVGQQAASEQALRTSAGEVQSFEGMITDSHCGAKHSAAVGKSAADCTRACVHSGEKFALVDGDKTYGLKGEEAALKLRAGQRVKISGALNGNTISVASIGASAP